MTINTGSTHINYTNVILISCIIVLGLATSIHDASESRERIAIGISELSMGAGNLLFPSETGQVNSDFNATYNLATNAIDAGSVIQIIVVILAIICISIAMFYVRGFA